MGLGLEYNEGQTPLDDDEKNGLRIETISTREELDEYEQQNIEEAVAWSMKRSLRPEIILTEEFIMNLHKRMYGNVWEWAGSFRKTNKNIGVDKWQIATDLRNLLDDTRLWIEKKIYSPDEVAIRFKHRLVAIHCFPNGNGRHSRLMADIIIDKLFNLPVFTWGSVMFVNKGEARTSYLSAIRKADAGNIEPLLQFARS